MEDFIKSIDEFLKFNRYEILENKGLISRKTAQQKAIDQYKEFNKHQKIVSDFDKAVQNLKGSSVSVKVCS